LSQSLYEIPVTRINGEPTTLGDYKGKVLLVVNVASKCGLTPQYEGLQKLYENKQAQGLEILGFPANNFGAQEPGTEAEISEFCSLNYGVSFPMFGKVSVNGEDRHPLYAALIEARPVIEDSDAMRERLKGYGIPTGPESDILWNFEKFLIDREGNVVHRFSPDITADDPRIVQALESALA
jgi:glutathione peroxidase